MFTFIGSNTDLGVILASLSGALVCALGQKQFNRACRTVAFFVSFTMGIIGADVTLEIIGTFLPGVSSNERAIGAFFCSALIITIMLNLIIKVDSFMEKITKK